MSNSPVSNNPLALVVANLRKRKKLPWKLTWQKEKLGEPFCQVDGVMWPTRVRRNPWGLNWNKFMGDWRWQESNCVPKPVASLHWEHWRSKSDIPKCGLPGKWFIWRSLQESGIFLPWWKADIKSQGISCTSDIHQQAEESPVVVQSCMKEAAVPFEFTGHFPPFPFDLWFSHWNTICEAFAWCLERFLMQRKLLTLDWRGGSLTFDPNTSLPWKKKVYDAKLSPREDKNKINCLSDSCCYEELVFPNVYGLDW